MAGGNEEGDDKNQAQPPSSHNGRREKATHRKVQVLPPMDLSVNVDD